MSNRKRYEKSFKKLDIYQYEIRDSRFKFGDFVLYPDVFTVVSRNRLYVYRYVANIIEQKRKTADFILIGYEDAEPVHYVKDELDYYKQTLGIFAIEGYVPYSYNDKFKTWDKLEKSIWR